MNLLKKLIIVLFIFLFFTTGMYSQNIANEIKRDSLHLTIYNQGYALVREVRNYNIPNGISTLILAIYQTGLNH